LHIPTISTAKSVQLIKDAKQKDCRLAAVAVHHLVLTDEKLEGFDTQSFSSITHGKREALLKVLRQHH
jgi:dihydroorotase